MLLHNSTIPSGTYHLPPNQILGNSAYKGFRPIVKKSPSVTVFVSTGIRI